jgi:hypothetical protein
VPSAGEYQTCRRYTAKKINREQPEILLDRNSIPGRTEHRQAATHARARTASHSSHTSSSESEPRLRLMGTRRRQAEAGAQTGSRSTCTCSGRGKSDASGRKWRGCRGGTRKTWGARGLGGDCATNCRRRTHTNEACSKQGSAAPGKKSGGHVASAGNSSATYNRCAAVEVHVILFVYTDRIRVACLGSSRHTKRCTPQQA